MSGKRREGSSQITTADIEKVLEISGQLFAEYGFDGVGIRLIAERSGVTMPSIFYHFGSKAMLYEEVLELKYERMTKMVKKALNSLDDPRAKLEFLIGAFFDLLSRDRTFLLLVHRDICDAVATKGRPSFLKEYSYIFSVFHRLLKDALHRQVERREALSLVSLIMGFCELTVMMSEADMRTEDEESWYAVQRAELIDVGKRICLI